MKTAFVFIECPECGRIVKKSHKGRIATHKQSWKYSQIENAYRNLPINPDFNRCPLSGLVISTTIDYQATEKLPQDRSKP